MKSMTAFGRAVHIGEGFEVTAELRSVNNRYLDWNFRLPRAYASVEERAKVALSHMGISRGKVDVTLTVADIRNRSGAVVLEPDMDAARRYIESAKALEDTFGIPGTLTVEKLMTLPGVMVPVKEDTTADDDTLWANVAPTLTEAAAIFIAAREREGARLGEDLLGKLAGIREMVSGIAAHAEENLRAYRARFEERLRAALGEPAVAAAVVFDESRILTECAVYADRVAIDEELVRLASHFDALEELFKSNEPVGRRIDFMLQETNREINTIGSKCSDAVIAKTVADVKSEFEKIREQVQNIE